MSKPPRMRAIEVFCSLSLLRPVSKIGLFSIVELTDDAIFVDYP
jgi:hypothetical protein